MKEFLFDLNLLNEFKAHKKIDRDGLYEYYDCSIHIDGLGAFVEMSVAYILLNEANYSVYNDSELTVFTILGFIQEYISL